MTLALTVAASTLLSGTVFAQSPDAASPWAGTDQSAVRLISASTAVGASGTARLGLQFRMKPGWKIYWRSPGDAGVAPQVDWAGSTNLAEVKTKWPLPTRYTIFGLTTFVYGNEVVLPMDIRANDAASGLSLKARVNYLVCEKVCIPYEADLALALGSGQGQPVAANRALIDRFAARVPLRLAPGAGVGAGAGKLQSGVFKAGIKDTDGRLTLEILARSEAGFKGPDILVEGPQVFRFGLPRVELSEDRHMALFRLPVGVAGRGTVPPKNPSLTLTLVDRGLAVEQSIAAPVRKASGGSVGSSLLVILGLAFLGGLILNLMPCVLPVLSIKVLSVVGHGGGEAADVRRGFLATAGGILFSFLVLAAGAIGLKAAGATVGWGIQFQEPLFLIVMASILVLFAANLFGLFEVPMPGFAGSAAQLGGNEKSLGGAFATGAFATLLATPCSAPFLGTAIGFALTRGTGEILSVFMMLGLGLATPYLAVATWPGLATGLPKPGRWMIILRRVLGVALLLTAVWLLSVLWIFLGSMGAMTVGVLLALVPCLYGIRRVVPSFRRAANVMVIALLVAVLAVPSVFGDRGQISTPSGKDDAGISWQAFDKVKLLNHVASGRVVFVDVTADWCVTCKANKALVINRGKVGKKLRGGAIIPMRADWTRPNAVISEYLRSFGRFGIPFNAVYGPGAPSGIALGELLTEKEVLAAINAAARRGLARQ